jgi:rubredoxin
LLFVEELCELALRCKIGKICLTPWKTLLIKDIRAEHRSNWEKLLGLHQISTGHAASELNWQLPDLDQATLVLKKRLVRELEEAECNTNGLSFAIGAQPMPVATSVLISPEPDTHATFCIRHTADFTRSNARWRAFARQVPTHALARKLRDLCIHYHANSAAPGYGQADPDPEPLRTSVKSADAAGMLYHCTHCLTVYDPQLGDRAAGVMAGTPFQLLPDCWACSLCEARKEDFVLVAG